MFRNALFVKMICGVTIYSFLLATIPQNVQAWGLPPKSFNEMYSVAQKGDVEALRASVYRGLNIDSVNRSGDTGLCVAAKRRDTYTYNAFRAAGANPRHPCTQRIVGYEDFVERSNAVPMAANSREAYSALGREKYRVAPWVWWAGGALLIGGVILALSLGGGGGGGSSDDKEAYDSLGVYAGTKAVIMKEVNQDTTNDKVLRHTNTNTEAISIIDFNYNVLRNAEYLDIVLKADKGATYTNAVDTLLQIGDGTIAMDAINGSRVINDGYIKVDTDNASIGMVASVSSTAINNGNSLSSSTKTNGIKMSFTGTEENDTIIGMYADTNSFISNNGEIQGTATLNTSGTATAIAGSMVGMEAMIINEGKNLSTDTINVVNTDIGKIKLSAGDGSVSSESDVAIELVGMGSYLDYHFLNGSKNINRAEHVLLQNYGDIELSYTGNYTSSSSTALRQGLGGVVGIRADANTKAFNHGNVEIKLNDNGSSQAVDVAAGMQSVHGGEITNNKNISITTPSSNNRINYGMLSVEGSGSVSSLYTGRAPVLTNSADATIAMEVSNSYGMASFNSGSLTNDGKIVLGSADTTTTQYTNNIAMYANGIRTPYATLANNGSIDIYSYASMAMQNDFGGATPLYNNGTIHVHRDAVDTVVFGGAYSQLVNKKDILYGATPSDDFTPTETSSDVVNPFANYSPIIGIAVMNTKPRTLGNEIVSSSSTTERIINDTDASITIYDASFISGMQVDTEQGIGINNGKISIENRDLESVDNVTNNIGMYLTADTKDNAYISNAGSIETNTDFAAAMASDSTGNASMLNEKTGSIKSTFRRSIGMYAAGRTIVRNSGSIDMQGDENTAVYINGTVDARNESTGKINVGAESEGEEDNSISTGYGFFTTADAKAKIENKGEINVYTKDRGAGIYTLGQDTINNMQDINVYTDDTNGIHIGGSANVTNSGTIKVGTEEKGVKNSHAIYVSAESQNSSVSNTGTIDFYNDTAEGTEHGYAIYSEGEADISNTGVINLHNPNSSAIYASGGTINNNATLNILHDNSWALEIADDADVTNDKNGIINVGTATNPVDKSYGILSNEDSTGTITNNGIINVYNKTDKTYGIYAKGTAEVVNTQYITAFNDNGTAVYATGTNSITNSGEIKALGGNSYAVRSNPEKDDEEGDQKKLTLVNTSTGMLILGQKDSESGVNKEGGAAVKAQTIDTIRNNGEIAVYNDNAIGIETLNGTLINNLNRIDIYGNGGVGISSGNVDTVKSSGSITLANGTSTDSVGILAQTGNSIETDGSITVNGSTGIGINSGTVKDVTNDAVITINNSAGGSIGIKSKSGTSLTNNGQIDINGKQGVAISSGDMTTVTNTGVINLSNTQSTGSVGILSANGTLLENKVDGKITISSGREAKAISVTGTMETVKNAAEISITTVKDSGYTEKTSATGINVVDTTTLENNGAITIQSEEGVAINSTSLEQKINLSNNAALNLNTTDTGTGIKVNSAVLVENKGKGVITIGGKYGKGIDVIGTATTVTNSAAMELNNSDGDSVGIAVNNGTSLTNSGAIEIKNKRGTAISSGTVKTVINTDAGLIMLNNSNGGSIGILSSGNSATDSSLTNNAKIEIANLNGIGIDVTDFIASIINSGTINLANVNSSNSFGIRATKGSTFSNSGNIIIGGRQGTGINLSGYWTNSISNTGNIHLTNSAGESMGISILGSGSSSSGSFSNTGEIGINGLSAIGINITGAIGSFTNIYTGVITLDNTNSSGSFGIRAANGSTFSNDGNITIGGKQANGINLSGYWTNSISNTGNIHLTNSAGESVGISVAGSGSTSSGSFSNEGSIDIDGLNAMGINITGSVGSFTNTNTGIITLDNTNSTGSFGIKATSGSTFSNAANITIGGKQATGINLSGYWANSVSNTGNISLTNTTGGSIGISAGGSGSASSGSFSNEGAISIGGLNSTGIRITGSVGSFTNANTGTIDLSNTNNSVGSTGISATGGSTFSNAADITIGGNQGRGIDLTDAWSSAVNNTGKIVLTNATGNSVGIAVSSGTGKLTNRGQIQVNGQTGIGISSGNLADVENTAQITLNNSTGGSFGIKAGSGKSITNSGNITISNLGGTGIQAGSMSGGISNDAVINLPGNVAGSKGIEVLTSGDVTTGTNSIIHMGSTGSTVSNNTGIITKKGNITNGGKIYMHSGGKAMVSNGLNSTLTSSDTISLSQGNSYGMYAASGSTLTNEGEILSQGDNNIAMYTNGNGTFVNGYVISMTGNYNNAMYAGQGGTGSFTNTGTITINGNYGYGMRVDSSGNSDTISNSGSIIINGTNSYGIYAGTSASSITNTGVIKVGNNSYGIWATNPNSVTNSKSITVGDNSYGIYVIVTGYDTPVDIKNTGTITIGNNSTAIYVYKYYVLEPQIKDGVATGKYYRDGTKISAGGAGKVVTGIGDGPWEKPDNQLVDRDSSDSTASVSNIVWFDDDDEQDTSQAVSLIQMAQGTRTNVNFLNSGTVVSDNAIDFGDGGTDGTQNILASGGQYVAESFRGTVHADASIVADGFETIYVNEDSFVGENNGIEVVSDSYMFNASTATNEAGNTNVVMSLRPFEEIVEDTNTSDFLAENYAAQRGENLFRVFRTASTQDQFNTAVNQALGLGIVPNFVKQNLDIERTLNLEIDDEIATASDKEYRASFNAVNFNNKVKAKKDLSGYKDNVSAVYGWLDTRASDLRTRGGLGVVLARSGSKFDDGSKRYNNMVEIFAPITYTQNDTVAMFKLKGGAGHGHYRRHGADKWYKGNTEEYYYGADTVLKHTLDIGKLEVTPNIGFNLTGMYTDDIDESNGGLKIRGKNMLSAQSSLGIDVAKTFAIDEAQTIKVGAGSKYYHEFGDRYHTSASVDDMIGSYDVTDERLQRNFGLMSLKAKYQYNQFSIEAEANAPLEQKRNPYYLLNLGYKF